MPNLFNKDFIEYIQLLNKHHVEYVLLGGMAVNLYGYRRATGDMDLFVNPTQETHGKLKSVHYEFGMFMGEMESLENFLNTDKYDVYTFGVSPIQIDVMTSCKGIDFDSVFNASRAFEIDSITKVNVLHINDLIQAKRSSGRTRDIADVEELGKIIKSKD